MRNPNPEGTHWTDREVDLIVADYFDMLRMELSGEPFVKAHRNEALQKLTGRSRASIEYKYRNISAVLEKLCRPRIVGYVPAANYQKALLDGIERYIDAHNDVIAGQLERISGLQTEAALYFEPAPTLLGTEAGVPDAVKRLVRKFDPAARDERNRALGERGEERVYFSERARLTGGGRGDLARKVRWVAKEDGDGAGFDVLSFSLSGEERLLEVKTTSGHQRTPFYLTENERLLSTERPDEFRLVRLYDFLRNPRAFELAPPLEQSVILRAANYRASFEA